MIEKNKQTQRLGIIGCGHLGSALAEGLIQAGYEVKVNNGDIARTQAKLVEYGLDIGQAASIEELAMESQVLFLCVKHAQLVNIGAQLNQLLNDQQIVVSCLAQATLAEVEAVFHWADPLVVKVMTTLGVKTRQGVTAYKLAEVAGEADQARVKNTLAAVSAEGCVSELLTEAEMQLFTLEAGCFPGVMAHFMDQWLQQILLNASEHYQTLHHDQMQQALLASTAGLLAESGNARMLRQKVATTKGVTAEAISEMGKAKLLTAVASGVRGGLRKMGGQAATQQNLANDVESFATTKKV